MSSVDVVVEAPICNTSFRVQQVYAMFGLQMTEKSVERFQAEIPGDDENWNIGVIVGPSGSGKSTVARARYGDRLYTGGNWPENTAVVDAFPEDLETSQIVGTLSAVGFSSPPAWLRPYSVLSNGEKFRCDLARAMLTHAGDQHAGDQQAGNLVVFDEFTSVVDRTVARIGSAAVTKAIRSNRVNVKRFVAVTCHYDVVEWLEPDWVLDMANRTLERGSLRRPQIKLQVFKVHSSAWQIFARHHYLTGELHKAAACFVAFWDETPVAFAAWLPFVGKLRGHEKAMRAHRIVCLPDFQGVGIGSALTETCARYWRSLNYRVFNRTSHPAFVSYMNRSSRWKIISQPDRSSPDRRSNLQRTRAIDRLSASFEFIG